MSGASIAAEVQAALQEVATEVGSGEFVVTLIRTAQAANPWDAAGATTETDIPAMVQEYPINLIDGTLIRQGDRKVMMSATGLVPTTADTLRISGKEYAIVMVKPYEPSGVPLYIEVQARA